jgi:drug/metabolite transporter (DMT)-like permease
MHSWLILGSAVGFGLTPTLVQALLQQQFSAETIALFRFGVPFLLFLPALTQCRHCVVESLRTALVGAISAIGMLVYYRLFNQMPATTLILVYYTYPLFAILIGCLFFNIPATRNRFIAAAMIAIAVMTTLDSPNVAEVMWWQWIASFAPPISFAFLLNYFSNPVAPLTSSARMSAALLGHMLILIPLIYWLQPDKLLPTVPTEIMWIVALGLLSCAIPQYLFARGSVKAGLESTTMIGSSEVIFAMAFTVIFLDHELSRSEYLAAILIVMSSLIRNEPNASIHQRPIITAVKKPNF